MADLPFLIFDADNHYYEAEDAFTRHLDPKMRRRCMDWAVVKGRKELLVAGAINRFIPNPTFNPVARPAASTSTTAATTRRATRSARRSASSSRSASSTATATRGSR